MPSDPKGYAKCRKRRRFHGNQYKKTKTDNEVAGNQCKVKAEVKDKKAIASNSETSTSPDVTRQDALKSMQGGPMRCLAARFMPGQELRQSLLRWVESCHLKAAFILTCVGSVTTATLRLADSLTIQTYEGPFEIVSLVGTLSGGHGHLHISLSDSAGSVIGGHVVGDLLVHTTAEVVVGEIQGVRFERENDEHTGYDELVVYQDQEQK